MSAFEQFQSQPPPAAPAALEAIERDTQAMGFKLASTRATGVMLRALAASKPDGRIMELGTGTGVAAAWLLDGMSPDSTLDTVDVEPANVEIARRHLGNDGRVRFHIGDGGAFLRALADAQKRFDLIFADTWPGKFSDLDVALSCLAIGGLYVVDDLLPQPGWPPEHGAKIEPFVRALVARADLWVWPIVWDTGILIATRRASSHE